MTELMENIQPFPRQATTHALGERRKAASNRAADKLDALVMASLGRPSALRAGPITSGSPPGSDVHPRQNPDLDGDDGSSLSYITAIQEL